MKLNERLANKHFQQHFGLGVGQKLIVDLVEPREKKIGLGKNFIFYFSNMSLNRFVLTLFSPLKIASFYDFLLTIYSEYDVYVVYSV